MQQLKKYFVPHEENNHQPHFLRHKSILAIFLIVIFFELGFLVQVFVVFDETKFLANVLPAVLTALTNEDRNKNGVEPLVENELLKKAAQEKANDMALLGYFAHTSPEGKTPWYWLDLVGYKYTHAGENLAVNFFESKDVEKAWMDSPTHRANIVKKNYTEIGIGVAKGRYNGRDTVFVAQFFGAPAKGVNTATVAIVSKGDNDVNTNTEMPKIPDATIPTPTVATASPTPTPEATIVLGEETTEDTNEIQSQVGAKQSNTTLFFQRILTSPRHLINNIYLAISLFILFALSFVVFVRSEIKHPQIIARGVTLVAVVVALTLFNFKLVDRQTEVPAEAAVNVTQAL